MDGRTLMVDKGQGSLCDPLRQSARLAFAYSMNTSVCYSHLLPNCLNNTHHLTRELTSRHFQFHTPSLSSNCTKYMLENSPKGWPNPEMSVRVSKCRDKLGSACFVFFTIKKLRLLPRMKSNKLRENYSLVIGV